MRRTLPLLFAVFALAGCTATSGSGSAGQVTTTATTTATTTVTTTPSPAASDADLAKRLAALACDRYVYSGTLDAASGSAPLADAASTATSAAVVDPSWTDLAGAIAFMSALPETDNTPADVDRATQEVAVIKARCGDAGVTVTS
jgi:hypothetical protein